MVLNNTVSFSTEKQTQCLLMLLCVRLCLVPLCGGDWNVNVSGSKQLEEV